MIKKLRDLEAKYLEEAAWLKAAAIKEAIAALPQWHLVTESLPDFDVDVLVTDGKRTLIGYRGEANWLPRGWRWCGSGIGGWESEWDFDDDYNGVSPVIAWMEVPTYG